MTADETTPVPTHFEFPPTAKGLMPFNLGAEFGWRDGPRTQYQGMMPWVRQGRVQRADAATFLYTGPVLDATGKLSPAISSSASGAIFDGVNLWRRCYPQKEISITNPLPPWDGSVGYLFDNPATATRISNSSIAGFETAILFGASNHTEHFLFENLHIFDCRVFFKNEENQAVAHHFQNIFQHHRCDILFQFTARQYSASDAFHGAGGNISIDTLVILDNCLLFDIELGNPNSCTFTLNNFKADANAKGWRLINQRKGPLNLTVRGHIGEKAAPAADAIAVPAGSDLDVELWWKHRIWPHDYQVVDGEWVLK